MNSPKHHTSTILALVGLAALDLFLWGEIALGSQSVHPALYFLDVGQGDATLVILPGNAAILTDAGPDRSIVQALERARARESRYIDLAVITHPERDHYNGFNELLRRYDVGAFLVNGRHANEDDPAWLALLSAIEAKGIPLIVAGEGDRIRYRDYSLRILSPSRELLESGELNDTGLVMFYDFAGWSALLAADIDSVIEEHLAERFELKASVLKIAHHGSKFSSDEAFLREVDPRIAVIQAGARNRYGHPAPEALSRLAEFTNAKVFRTDLDGTIRIEQTANALRVFTGQ